jgi:hypothetical protein
MYLLLKDKASLLVRFGFSANFIVTRCCQCMCMDGEQAARHVQTMPRRNGIYNGQQYNNGNIKKIGISGFSATRLFFAMLDFVALPECILACFAGLSVPQLRI